MPLVRRSTPEALEHVADRLEPLLDKLQGDDEVTLAGVILAIRMITDLERKEP